MKIAILGYGNVGKSILKYIEGDSKDIQVAYVLRRPGKATESFMTEDFGEILADPEVATVVDALSGSVDSFDYMKKALDAGKNVVSANKAAIASDMRTLIELAAARGVQFKYEASAGGTIPIVNELLSITHTNYVSSVYGILNGTTNYILDKMLREGSDFAETLKEAQELGYAEFDPTADISGTDVRNKLIILMNTAFHGFVGQDVPVLGIEKITSDILGKYTGQGRIIKLLGISLRDGDAYACGVVPCVLGMDVPEAHVGLNYNMVSIVGDMCGDLKLYGQGAGGLPTADALLRDIYAIFNFRGNDAEVHFFRELRYEPELVRGIGYIGDEKIEGSLEELINIARKRDEFMAFEWPNLALHYRPVIAKYMQTVRD